MGSAGLGLSYCIYLKYSHRAYSVDPDKMLQNAVSNQGLYCLLLIDSLTGSKTDLLSF